MVSQSPQASRTGLARSVSLNKSYVDIITVDSDESDEEPEILEIRPRQSIGNAEKRKFVSTHLLFRLSGAPNLSVDALRTTKRTLRPTRTKMTTLMMKNTK